MATRKKSGVSPQNIFLFIFIGGLIGFFLGRATAPKIEATEGEKDPVTQAEMTLASGDTGKKLNAVVSPFKGPADAPVVIHEVSDFQ